MEDMKGQTRGFQERTQSVISVVRITFPIFLQWNKARTLTVEEHRDASVVKSSKLPAGHCQFEMQFAHKDMSTFSQSLPLLDADLSVLVLTEYPYRHGGGLTGARLMNFSLLKALGQLEGEEEEKKGRREQ